MIGLMAGIVRLQEEVGETKCKIKKTSTNIGDAEFPKQLKKLKKTWIDKLRNGTLHNKYQKQRKIVTTCISCYRSMRQL